jgi:hypothetical protein
MRALPVVGVAVACEPTAFGSRESFEEHLADGRRLLDGTMERRELADGWALRLPNDDATLLAFARWSTAERRCCPFFTFALEREPDPGALWVRITGPEGAKAVLDAALVAL